ncbi:MAG: UDP-N-acetylmuramoyl-tripeptide--D-alanyl-D-alanine ligase [Calditrichia bacterium]|nr:UDP-N-acetylmuramoyl-tripeptide--D-alanyl-D-alanine ligase [Calditrichia bacterium]
MNSKNLEKLYADEISLLTPPEYSDYVNLNLKKIREFRRNFNIPIIGVAGTEGKSTTKRMLSAILSQRGPVLETPLDCDSASVVTSTLLQLEKQYQYGLLELGIINHQQFKLAVDVAEPNIGVITNIGEAHLARMGDKYKIADAKVELVRHLNPQDFAVLNIDDELVSGMESFAKTQRIIKFGFNQAAHFYATDIDFLGPDGVEFTLNNYYKFNLPIYGSTAVSNALAAIATARILNFEFEEIIEGLKKNFKLIPGRGNFTAIGDVQFLDHTYNATVNSVSKACESLVQFKKYSNNLILVLGSLEELGDESKEIHMKIGYYISALPIDVVLTVGNDARYVGDGIRQINHNKKVVQHCEAPQEIPALVPKYIQPNTTLLMIGGRSLKLSTQLKKLMTVLKKS